MSKSVSEESETEREREREKRDKEGEGEQPNLFRGEAQAPRPSKPSDAQSHRDLLDRAASEPQRTEPGADCFGRSEAEP